MTFDELIKQRYSCREFKDEKIKDSEVNAILEAARLAPTAVNYQPQRIVVVENEDTLNALKEATRFTFDAKTIFVICYDKDVSWKRRSDQKEHGDIDCAIVTTYMMLKATELGIGSCYVCSMKQDMVRDILNLPQNYVISAMLPVGYPVKEGKQNTRKDLSEIVIYK